MSRQVVLACLISVYVKVTPYQVEQVESKSKSWLQVLIGECGGGKNCQVIARWDTDRKNTSRYE